MTIRVLVERPAAELIRYAVRAELLADAAHDPEPLRFAAGLLRVQAEVVGILEAKHAAHVFSGRPNEDVRRILAPLLEVPRFVARAAPQPLAREAESRSSEDASDARTRLLVYWGGGRTSAEDYLSRAMLRPYLEVLRAEDIPPERPRRGCPFCGGDPAVGAVRGGIEDVTGARSLHCALCGLEWEMEAVLCVACGERDPAKLASFASDVVPGVRLDTCQACGRYLKTLDLAHDPGLLPEVDDLTSLALDQWADQQGFTRVEPGLVGI